MDLKDPKWMYLKAALFILIGVTSCGLIMVECPSFKILALLLLATWAFCRAYYFAFYVIEKYTDPQYKFSGLIDFVKYVVRRK